MNRIKSSLTSFVRLSPNCNKPRSEKIRRLTPHCVAGNLTIEATLGISRFINSDSVNGASCNYAIGSDGRIGLGVEETNRAWCTSSRTNDMEAITFEISNVGSAPDWRISDDAINSWLNLAVDIAKFYGFKQIAYQTKPSNINASQVEKWINTWASANAMIITLHCWYANKACPGPYFIRQIPWLVKEMNKRLSGGTPEKFIGEGATPTPTPTPTPTNAFVPYMVTIKAPALNVREKPSNVSKVVKTLIEDKNVYTIIEEADGPGATKWCKLKSGAGWISKDFVTKK